MAKVSCPHKILLDTIQRLVSVYVLILVSWPYWFATEARPLIAILNDSLLEKKNFEVSCTTFDWPGRPAARISGPPHLWHGHLLHGNYATDV